MANERSRMYRYGERVRQFPGDVLAADQIMKEMVLGAGLGAVETGQRGVADFASGVMGTPQAPPPGMAPRVPAPRRPPQPPPALDFDARIKQLDEMDRQEQEYMKDPDAFEQRRMAAPPTSGELRYSTGGPERSFNVGANRTDVMGDDDFKRYHNDMVFGQKRTPALNPDAGRKGTVSMMTALNDPMEDKNYRNYLANAGRLDEAMAERASIARNEMLAKSPFAEEEAAIDRAIRMQDAQARAAGMKQQATTQAKVDALQQLDAHEMMLRSRIDQESSTPQERAEAMAALEIWRQRQEVALGLRDRMDGAL